MLVKVKRLNYDGVGYAPLTEEALVNTDHVMCVEKADPKSHRTDGPCVRVVFQCNPPRPDMICRGTVADFYEGAGG